MGKATPPPPTICEAEPMPGPLGVIWYLAVLDFDAAVARRQAGLDVVVRGPDHVANRRLAQAIEAAIGQYKRCDPHEDAGPQALPHYQPDPRTITGHSFYETTRLKARKKP